MEGKVQGAIIQGKARFEGRTIDLLTSRSAQDVTYVLESLERFKPSPTPQVSANALRQKLGPNKILCVRGIENTEFKKAIERDGFFEGAFEEFFEEVTLDYHSHPQALEQRITSHPIVLYAFHGLSHMTGTALDSYSGKLFRRALSRECIAELKKYLIENP